MNFTLLILEISCHDILKVCDIPTLLQLRVFKWILSWFVYIEIGRDADHSPPLSAEVKNE
jgi:hypothetical protein